SLSGGSHPPPELNRVRRRGRRLWGRKGDTQTIRTTRCWCGHDSLLPHAHVSYSSPSPRVVTALFCAASFPPPTSLPLRPQQIPLARTKVRGAVRRTSPPCAPRTSLPPAFRMIDSVPPSSTAHVPPRCTRHSTRIPPLAPHDRPGPRFARAVTRLVVPWPGSFPLALHPASLPFAAGVG
ncbi:hypothetical protein C8R44DRAFT_351388, partial [Mycena epipterygia]